MVNGSCNSLEYNPYSTRPGLSGKHNVQPLLMHLQPCLGPKGSLVVQQNKTYIQGLILIENAIV